MIYKLLGQKLITWEGTPVQIVGLVFSPKSEMYRVRNLKTGKEYDLESKAVCKVIKNQNRIRNMMTIIKEF